MWVGLKLKLTPKGDYDKTGVTTIFVNFFMQSPRQYPNGQIIIVTSRLKHPKLDHNLQFTPLSETTSILLQGSPLGAQLRSYSRSPLLGHVRLTLFRNMNKWNKISFWDSLLCNI